MAHITLVRHGQANSGTQDEASYDKLSPLGHQQAIWLGEHLRDTGHHFDRVISGTLRRHVETETGMRGADFGPVSRDARFNELSYFTMADQYKMLTGAALPTDRDGFVHHLPRVFEAWQRGDIDSDGESFAAFHTRITDAIREISARGDRVLVVSSGGVIGLILSHILGLDTPGYAKLVLSIMNSSTHSLASVSGDLMLSRFNNISHLEDVGRHHAQTYI